MAAHRSGGWVLFSQPLTNGLDWVYSEYGRVHIDQVSQGTPILELHAECILDDSFELTTGIV